MATPALALIPAQTYSPQAIVANSGQTASMRFLEFFTVNLRNRNTRAAYSHAVSRFLDWCDLRNVTVLNQVQPVHVAGYIEQLGQSASVPTAKLHLAAIRALFDWLVTGQIVPANPAQAVRGPRLFTRNGQTPILGSAELRVLLDGINTATPIGLRDRALIGLMLFTFARVSAAVNLELADYTLRDGKRWVRLQEKRGTVNQMPCHHVLQEYLDAYIAATGITQGSLFRSASKDGILTGNPLSRIDAYRIVRRAMKRAGLGNSAAGCHTFRASGITAYLKAGGALEVAQVMAGHADSRTTRLYDRRQDLVKAEEVERIDI
ncbi:MAG TPA: tyrosine-type recombinase/integrase [Terriglobia bacterium]|nr:tyrosine-type recombinase/integrase [Terriglobia bacterium]HUZ46212.1 tyrosine-type recombinase/integrase [Terriglobia bacterium]